jgi:hypothetical protein
MCLQWAVQNRLNQLLEKTYSYITIEELSDIPFAIMRRLPAVPAEYLTYICKSDELYEVCLVYVRT